MCNECIAFTGRDRPSLKDLYDHVVMNVASKWRDLGVQLLRPDQETILDIIEKDCPHDAASCCKRVFKDWLDTTTDATWNELIRALRSPSVQLDYVASKLEQKMVTECKGYSSSYHQFSLCVSPALCCLGTRFNAGNKNIKVDI